MIVDSLAPLTFKNSSLPECRNFISGFSVRQGAQRRVTLAWETKSATMGRLNSTAPWPVTVRMRSLQTHRIARKSQNHYGGCVALSKEEIEKIAFLARIRIDSAGIEALETELTNILGLVDQLQAADTDSVEAMAHPLDAAQRLRPDAVTETNQREVFQAVAPATENGFYLVPRVIE
jgi:aspartyl-tRNA(Asn)/glutamyl-tRNA(Gln) amidotransferase subunit C